MRVRSALLVLLSVSCLMGCEPRGETHTVEQVLADARKSFDSEMKKEVQGEAGAALKTISERLDGIVRDPKTFGESATAIADQLSTLVEKAGYPSRPPMGELIKQYRAVSSGAGATEGDVAARAKLLAARTYTLLASELDTARFSAE